MTILELFLLQTAAPERELFPFIFILKPKMPVHLLKLVIVMFSVGYCQCLYRELIPGSSPGAWGSRATCPPLPSLLRKWRGGGAGCRQSGAASPLQEVARECRAAVCSSPTQRCPGLEVTQLCIKESCMNDTCLLILKKGTMGKNTKASIALKPYI